MWWVILQLISKRNCTVIRALPFLLNHEVVIDPHLRLYGRAYFLAMDLVHPTHCQGSLLLGEPGAHPVFVDRLPWRGLLPALAGSLWYLLFGSEWFAIVQVIGSVAVEPWAGTFWQRKSLGIETSWRGWWRQGRTHILGAEGCRWSLVLDVVLNVRSLGGIDFESSAIWKGGDPRPLESQIFLDRVSHRGQHLIRLLVVAESSNFNRMRFMAFFIILEMWITKSIYLLIILSFSKRNMSLSFSFITHFIYCLRFYFWEIL